MEPKDNEGGFPSKESNPSSPGPTASSFSASTKSPKRSPTRSSFSNKGSSSSSLSSLSSSTGKKSKKGLTLSTSPSSLTPNSISVPSSFLGSNFIESSTVVSVSPDTSILSSSSSSPYTLTIHVSFTNILSILILLGMACLGGYYLYRLSTRKRCNCPLCDNTYKIKEKLGSGGFGSVYTVEKKTSSFPSASSRTPSDRTLYSSSTKSSRSIFVLKQIYVEDVKEANEAMREARELRYLTHPRIVQYYDDFLHYAYPSYLASEIYQALYVCIIMEQCTGGDLKQRISKIRKHKITLSSSSLGYPTVINNEATVPLVPPLMSPTHNVSTTRTTASTVSTVSTVPISSVASPATPSTVKIPSQHHIPEYLIARWTTQIAMALKYCHSKGVCHRDIKSQNIFLTDNDDVRIGDFGLAKSFHKHKPITLLSDAGTDCYKSPETFIGGKRDARKADIWAVGLVLLELTTNIFTWERKEGCIGALVVPFISNATNNNTTTTNNNSASPSSTVLPPLIENLLHSIPTDIYSSQLRLLIKRCLTPDPDLRPSAEELFRFKLLRYGSNTTSSSSHTPSSSGVPTAITTMTTTTTTNLPHQDASVPSLTVTKVPKMETNSTVMNPSLSNVINPNPASMITNTARKNSTNNTNNNNTSTLSPHRVRVSSFTLRKPSSIMIPNPSRILYSTSSSNDDSTSTSSHYDSLPSDDERTVGQHDPSLGPLMSNAATHTIDNKHQYPLNEDILSSEPNQWKSVQHHRISRYPSLTSHPVQTDVSYATTDKDESLPPVRQPRPTNTLPLSTPTNPFMVLASDSPKVRNKHQRHRVRQRK